MKIIQKITDGALSLCMMSFGFLCLECGMRNFYKMVKGELK